MAVSADLRRLTDVPGATSTGRPHLLIEGLPDHEIVPDIAAALARHDAVLRCVQRSELDGEHAMRIEFDVTDFHERSHLIHKAICDIIKPHNISCRLRSAASSKSRVALLLSRESPCALALVGQSRRCASPLLISKIVSNRPDLPSLSDVRGVDYHYVPVLEDYDFGAEGQQICLFSGSADLIAMTHYEYGVSEGFLKAVGMPVITVRVSASPKLPDVVPDRREFYRGTRLIGATAHYVTDGHNYGPVVIHETERITDGATDEDQVRRRVESLEARALVKAVTLHAEDRVVPTGSGKVILFQPTEIPG